MWRQEPLFYCHGLLRLDSGGLIIRRGGRPVALSRWRVELPHENNFFEMEQLSDVILNIGYTSREGGEGLRRAATECDLPGAGWCLFDFVPGHRELCIETMVLLYDRCTHCGCECPAECPCCANLACAHRSGERRGLN